LATDFSREDVLREFAVSLPKIRGELKMSQGELGKKVGLSRQSISSIERQQVPLTWNTMLAICMVLIVNEPEIMEKMAKDQRFMELIEELKSKS